MQTAQTCALSKELLSCSTEFADRFVYAGYFVPLPIRLAETAVPLLSHNQKTHLAPYFSIAPEAMYSALRKLKLDDLLAQNGLADMPRTVAHMPATNPDACAPTPEEVGPVADVERWMQQIVAHVRDLEDLVSPASGAEDTAGAAMRAMLDRKRSEILEAASAISDRLGKTRVAEQTAQGARDSASGSSARGGVYQVPETQLIDLVVNLLRTEIGWLFLDRTRIRPVGFAVGEHVHSMSLAPGEELVMEQKAFSKRQATYEQTSEQERQFDLELSSTLSTELQEGLDEQVNKNSTNGQGLAGVTGFDVGINLFDIVRLEKFKATEASNDTRRRSAKDSHSVTSKLASKYRALHKITFKISTETGFETTAKRTIRNPNKYTPIQLHYFKILRKLEMTQERYGVRLCWSPTLQDPGRDLYQRIQAGRAAIMQSAEQAIGLPDEPALPVQTTRPPVMVTGTAPTGGWNVDGSANTFVFVPIPIPPGMIWDRSFQQIKVRVETKISVGRILLVVPIVAVQVGQTIRVQTNIIVTPRTDWLNTDEWSAVMVEASARFIPDPSIGDPAYKKAFDEWQVLKRAWEKQVADLQAQGKATAQLAADEWETETLTKVNPLSEMMARFIAEAFRPAVKDEYWEVDLWQKIFDWGSATFKLYPGWWSTSALRDPSKPAGHLFNASWARLYVPVNPGYERMALRWIFGKVIATPLSPVVEAAFEAVVADLNDYRDKSFGTEEVGMDGDGDCPELADKFLCLARWKENLPTDGTHLEVVQSGTSTVDTYTHKDMRDTDELRRAMIEGRNADTELKTRVGTQVREPVSVKIVLAGEPRSSQE